VLRNQYRDSVLFYCHDVITIVNGQSRRCLWGRQNSSNFEYVATVLTTFITHSRNKRPPFVGQNVFNWVSFIHQRDLQNWDSHLYRRLAYCALIAAFKASLNINLKKALSQPEMNYFKTDIEDGFTSVRRLFYRLVSASFWRNLYVEMPLFNTCVTVIVAAHVDCCSDLQTPAVFDSIMFRRLCTMYRQKLLGCVHRLIKINEKIMELTGTRCFGNWLCSVLR
jgi:hypothetical protein